MTMDPAVNLLGNPVMAINRAVVPKAVLGQSEGVISDPCSVSVTLAESGAARFSRRSSQ